MFVRQRAPLIVTDCGMLADQTCLIELNLQSLSLYLKLLRQLDLCCKLILQSQRLGCHFVDVLHQMLIDSFQMLDAGV